MRLIFIVIEACDYQIVMNANMPNLQSLDPHPATAFGIASRPSTAAIVGGVIPVCNIAGCHHREIKQKLNSPFFLSAMSQITEKQLYLCPNGWSLEILLPWMSREQRELNFKWHDSHQQLPAKEETDYFLKERKKYDSYFAYIHYFESHAPFYSPKGIGDPEASLAFIDEQIGRILNECSGDSFILAMSDHGRPPKPEEGAVFSLPSPKTMLSFIASNFTAGQLKSWSELGVSPHSIARRRWLK